MTPSDSRLLAELGPLLDEALVLDPADRIAWLTRLRLDRPALAAEVEALLAREAELDAVGFLASSPWSDAQAISLAGHLVGAYTLEQPIGRGGMGTVWLARRSDGRFEGRVAVKLLNLALLDPVGGERFRREGNALARLTHPGIGRLIDAGVTDTGQPFLVLDHVDGVRIDRYCDEHRLGMRERILLFQQVLAAVAHAHANLIVHRDLKPSNILVTADGSTKLLDFGIAKLLNDGTATAEHTELTEAGGLPLTPEYAAPEQVTGGAITTATDVYALGVLLYLLLSARHPTDTGSLTTADRLRGVVEVEPARLSSTVRGAGDLDNILGKALEKDAGRRYPTVAAFSEDIDRFLRHEPVHARRPSLGYRWGKFVRRNRAGVAGGVIVLGTLLAATAFSLIQMREARRQRDAAVYEEDRADAQVEFQSLMLTSMGPERVSTREIIDAGVVLLRQEYSDDPRVAASIAIALATAYQELGESDKQLALLKQAEAWSAAAGNGDLLLVSRCSRASNLADHDLNAQARALSDSVRTQIEHASPRYAAACLEQVAAVEFKLARFDSAASLGHRAELLMERAGMTRGVDYISVLNSEANALENLKRRREALAIYERLAATMDSTGRGQTTTRNVIRNNIGIALSNLGEMSRAEPILRKTVEVFHRGNPTEGVHPAILVNYCRTVLFMQKLDTAAVWYEQLYTQSAARHDSAMAADGAHGMAEVALARGRLDEAARWIELERRFQRVAPNQRPGTSLALDAALAGARGNVADANALFVQALRQLGFFDGKRPYQMRSVLIQASESARDSGDPATAVEYARAAAGIARSDSLSELRSAYVGEARLIEGSAMLAAGDTAGARALIERALRALRSGAGPEHPRVREGERLLAKITPVAREARATPDNPSSR